MWRKPESHELKEISVWLRTDFIKLSVCAENEGQDVQNLDPDHSTALIPEKKEREMLFLGICLNREWTSVELLYSLNCFIFDEFYYINTVIFLFYSCEAALKLSK